MITAADRVPLPMEKRVVYRFMNAALLCPDHDSPVPTPYAFCPRCGAWELILAAEIERKRAWCFNCRSSFGLIIDEDDWREHP